MTLSTDDLIAALRLRYDYYSARSMFELACERAELVEKPAYDVAEVRAWRTALVTVGDRLDHVLARIDLMLGDESRNTASFEGVPAAQTASTREETAASAPTAPSQAASPNETAAAKPSVHATTGEETAVVTPKASAPTAPAQAASPKETAAAKPSVHATTGEEAAVVTPKASAQAASAQATTREDTAKASTEDAVETTIVLTGVDVAEGEQILVCGAFPELGDWDPERARLMSRTGDEWLATIKVAPDTKVPFKFLRRTADGNVIWESGADRSLVAKPRLDATWR